MSPAVLYSLLSDEIKNEAGASIVTTTNNRRSIAVRACHLGGLVLVKVQRRVTGSHKTLDTNVVTILLDHLYILVTVIINLECCRYVVFGVPTVYLGRERGGL